MISGAPPIVFPIDGTLDQSVDAAKGPPGLLVEAHNVRKTQAGHLEVRGGYRGVLQPSAAVVRGFGHDGSQTVTVNTAYYEAYASDSDTWSKRDRATRWVLEGARDIAQDAFSNRRFGACASAGGVTLHVWTYDTTKNTGSVTLDPKENGVYMLALDETTGAVVRGPEKISPSTQTPGTDQNCPMLVRVATDGTNFYIVWMYLTGGAANELHGFSKSLTFVRGTSSWGAPTLIAVDLAAANPCFDMHYAAGALWLAYNKIATLRVATLDSSLAITQSTDIVAKTTRTIAISVNANNTWVAYVDMAAETQVRLARCTSTTALSVDALAFTVFGGGPLVTTLGLANNGNDEVMVIASDDTKELVACYCNWQKATWTGAAIVMSGVRQQANCGALASQPIYAGGEYYTMLEVGHTGTAGELDAERPYSRLVLTDLTHDGGATYAASGGARDTGTVKPHLALAAGRTKVGTWAGLNTVLPKPRLTPQKVFASSNNSDVFVWDASIAVLGSGIVASLTGSYVGVTEYRLRLVAPGGSAAHVPTYRGNTTITTGGTHPYQYDGQYATELGFLTRPAVKALLGITFGAGGALSAGNYMWGAIWEYTDANGERHRSAPTFITGTAAANDKATLTFYPLCVTAKQDRESNPLGTEIPNTRLQLVLYRSTVGPSSLMYRVGTIVAGTNNPITNNPEAGTMVVVDGASDASIAVNQLLYTVTGELACELPPPAVHAVVFQNRLACIDAEKRERIYFSKPFVNGIGIEFSSALETSVGGIGPLTALAEMDGVLYAFSKNGIAVAAYGDGQDALGGGTWPEPKILTRGCGCTDARAVCVSQDGIVFGSWANGRARIWLLPRGGGAPVEIGSKVRAYLGYASRPTPIAYTSTTEITSIVNWAEDGRVMIDVRGNGVSDWCLEYDYINRAEDGNGTWSTHAVNTGNHAFSSGWVANGAHWHGSKDNTYVWRSTPGVYADKDYTAGSQTFVLGAVTTHALKIEGAAPRGKINAIDVDFAQYGPGTLAMRLLNVTGTDLVTSASFTISGAVSEAHGHVQWQPPVRRDDTGEAFFLRLEFFVGSPYTTLPPTPRGVTLDYIPLGGYYRPKSTERM